MLGPLPPLLLPPTRREPAEQDATRRDSLAQRQAETNNAAPRLEAVIPAELRGYLCGVWVYIMSVAIPTCQLVSYSETRVCTPRHLLGVKTGV